MPGAAPSVAPQGMARPLMLVAALGAALALQPMAGAAQVFDPPTYGTVALAPDMGQAIDSYEIEAGGQDPATTLWWECSGNINAAAPDLVVSLRAPTTRLSIFATADEDLTLVVRRPSGVFQCNDDTDGLNPAVVVLKPSVGDYAIWLGTFSTDLVPARLHLSQAAPDWPSVTGRAPQGAPGAAAQVGMPLQLQPTTDAGAAQLGQAVIEALETTALRMGAGAAMGATFTTETPVVAQTDGPRVAVTLPGLELHLDDLRLRFGTPRVEVAALGDGGQQWQATLDPAVEVIADGMAQGAVVWSDSRLSGRIDPDLGMMTDLDLGWSDLAWQPRDPSHTLRLEARGLTITSQIRPAGEGLFSGPATLRLTDLGISDIDGALSVGQLEMRSTATGFDPAMGRALDDLTRALTEGRAPGDLLAPLLQGRWGAGENALTVQNVSFETRDGTGSGLSLQRLHLGGGVDGRGEMGSLQLSWSAEGAEVRGPGWPAPLNPAGAALALRLDNLPLRQLLGLAAEADPADEDALALLGLQALGLLMSASPTLQIETLGLGAGEAALTSEGAFRLRDGFVGEGTLEARIKGLDGLIEMASAGDLGGEAARDMVPALIALRGLGARDPAGGADLLYRVELAPDLSVMVNGLDIRRLAP